MNTRRQFVKDSAAGLFLAGMVPLLNGCLHSLGQPRTGRKSRTVLIPVPSVSWADSTPLFGDVRLTGEETRAISIAPGGFSDRESSLRDGSLFGELLQRKQASIFCDFSLAKDRVGRWHCIGNELRVDSDEPSAVFHHHIAERLTGPYRRMDPVTVGFTVPASKGVLDPCAPYIAWKDPATAYLFYGHAIGKPSADGTLTYDEESSLRILKSVDGTLEHWAPRYPDSELENELFREVRPRDPMVLWDAERQMYYLYYSHGDGWHRPESECGLQVRTSTDLKNWSAAKTLMLPPPGYRNAESPFVIKRNGLYYLWVCGFDWGRMSLYISEDPTDFGHPVENRIMEQSGHTPEIVVEEGRDWMACAGISRIMGRPWGFCDLLGTYIQPLNWIEANPEQLAKIVRA